VARRDLARWIEEMLDLGTRSEHENRARLVAGADEHVPRLGGAVEVVPLPQRPFLLLDDQRALAGKHEEAFLDALGVVQRIGLARRKDADADADILEGVLLRLEGYVVPLFPSLRTASASPRLRTNQPSDVM
jgi:hypothetical protein